MSLVHANDVSKTYQAGEVDVRAIKGLIIEIELARYESFVGSFVSGQTTQLKLIGFLEDSTS